MISKFFFFKHWDNKFNIYSLTDRSRACTFFKIGILPQVCRANSRILFFFVLFWQIYLMNDWIDGQTHLNWGNSSTFSFYRKWINYVFLCVYMYFVRILFSKLNANFSLNNLKYFAARYRKTKRFFLYFSLFFSFNEILRMSDFNLKSTRSYSSLKTKRQKLT